MGAGVEEGRRRGWLTNVYRGELPDLAEQVAGKYDVLSMHHYLEHVVDPRGEHAGSRFEVVAARAGDGQRVALADRAAVDAVPTREHGGRGDGNARVDEQRRRAG